ncbi:hypothetical protein SEA_REDWATTLEHOG_140 [Gordonia phage RedWattleHog]|nr:hypothetical protein SEA_REDWATTLEHOG_140 [Gordonia phage RedWattleHog]
MPETDIYSERLLAVFNLIADQPQAHDQGHWGTIPTSAVRQVRDEIEEVDTTDSYLDRALPNKVAIDCGTAACFAGWTVLREGGKPVLSSLEISANARVDGDVMTFGNVLMPGEDEPRSVAQVATELLFGDRDRRWLADDLFNGYNTRSIIRGLVLDLLNGVDDALISERIDAEAYGEQKGPDGPDDEAVEPIRFDESLGVYV